MPEQYRELRKIFGSGYGIQDSSRRNSIGFEKRYSPSRLFVTVTIKPSQLSLFGKSLVDRLEHRVSERTVFHIRDWDVSLLGGSRIEIEFELSRSKKKIVRSKIKKLSRWRKFKLWVVRLNLKRKGLMKW